MVRLFGLAVILFCDTVQADWVDNFDGNEPNQAVWTFVNPLGDGSFAMTGGGMSINVPPRTNHDIEVPIEAPRLMADFNNVNFTIETKFNSLVTLGYQMQGLLIQQDLNNFIRFDVAHNGSNVYLYAAYFSGGTKTDKQYDHTTGSVVLFENKSARQCMDAVLFSEWFAMEHRNKL